MKHASWPWLAGLVLAATCSAVPVDTATVDRVTSLSGTMTPARIYVLATPRRDVPIRLAGQPLPAALAPVTRFSFKPGMQAEAVLMADITLFSDELTPAIRAALDGGLAVTSLAEPMAGETPGLYAMHVEAEGRTADLAAGVRKILDAIHSVRAKSAAVQDDLDASVLAAPSSIDPKPLDAILGPGGTARDGVYRFTQGRTTTMASCGCRLGPEMGIESSVTFYGTNAHAFATGQIACFGAELTAVLDKLTAGGIHVTSISPHLGMDVPKIYFVSFLATGPADTIAHALDAAMAERMAQP